MKALIIEDEPLAADRLKLLLQQYNSRIEVLAAIDSVEESVQWLQQQPAPDFILLDIHLADGSAFEIFHHVKVQSPVIFTTAYDQYALDAFKVLSVDYLLKPVTVQALTNAIEKLLTLRKQNHLPPAITSEAIQTMLRQLSNHKTRFVGKVGQKLFFIDCRDIAFFAADNKLVYLVAHDGSRYIVDYTLDQLEALTDEKLFFRANRSIIIHAPAIMQAKPYVNNRMKLLLKAGTKQEEVIISRERVADFRKWADN